MFDNSTQFFVFMIITIFATTENLSGVVLPDGSPPCLRFSTASGQDKEGRHGSETAGGGILLAARMVDSVTAEDDKIALFYKLEEICELLFIRRQHRQGARRLHRKTTPQQEPRRQAEGGSSPGLPFPSFSVDWGSCCVG